MPSTDNSATVLESRTGNSPAELVAMVAGEVAAGLAASQDLGTLDLIDVTRVVVRVGEPVGQFVDAAWQAEVELKTPLAFGSTQVGGQNDPILSGSPALATAIGGLPVEAIEGIGDRWAHSLEEVGITTIGELARLDPSELARLAGKVGRSIITFAARARLCAVEVPAVDFVPEMSLGSLIDLHPQSLSELFRFGIPSAFQLSTALGTLAASLDRTALGALTAKQLLTA